MWLIHTLKCVVGVYSNKQYSTRRDSWKKGGIFSFDVATSKEVVHKETCSSLINAPMEHQNPFFGGICSIQVVVVGLI